MADNDEKDTEESTHDDTKYSLKSAKDSALKGAESAQSKLSEMSSQLNNAQNAANELSSQVSGLAEGVSASSTDMINSLTPKVPDPTSTLTNTLSAMPNPMASATDSLSAATGSVTAATDSLNAAASSVTAATDSLTSQATDLKSQAIDSMSPSHLSSQFEDSTEDESSVDSTEEEAKAKDEDVGEPEESHGQTEPFNVNGGTYPNFLPNLGEGGAVMMSPVPPIPFQCTGSGKAKNLNICVLGDEESWISPPIPYMPPPNPPNVPIPGMVTLQEIKMPGDSPADKIFCDGKKVLCMSQKQGDATAQVTSPAMYQPPPTPAGPPPPFPDSNASYPAKFTLVQTIDPGTDEATPLSYLSESGKEAAGIAAITGDGSGFMQNISSKIPPIPQVPPIPDFPYALPQFPNIPDLPMLPQLPQMTVPQTPLLNFPNTALINMGSFGLPTNGMSSLLAQSGADGQSVPPLGLGLSDLSAMEPQVIIIYIDPSQLYQKGFDFMSQQEQSLLSQIQAQSPFDSSQYLSQFQDRFNAGQLASLCTLPYGQSTSSTDLYQQMAQYYPNFQDSQALQNLTNQFAQLSQMMPQGSGALDPNSIFAKIAPTLSPISMDLVTNSFSAFTQSLQLQAGSANNLLGATNFFQNINMNQASSAFLSSMQGFTGYAGNAPLPGLQGFPGLGALGGQLIPPMPAMPQMPAMSAVDTSASNFTVPPMPQIPAMPEIPAMPALPPTPAIPPLSIPSADLSSLAFASSMSGLMSQAGGGSEFVLQVQDASSFQMPQNLFDVNQVSGMFTLPPMPALPGSPAIPAMPATPAIPSLQSIAGLVIPGLGNLMQQLQSQQGDLSNQVPTLSAMSIWSSLQGGAAGMARFALLFNANLSARSIAQMGLAQALQNAQGSGQPLSSYLQNAQYNMVIYKYVIVRKNLDIGLGDTDPKKLLPDISDHNQCKSALFFSKLNDLNFISQNQKVLVDVSNDLKNEIYNKKQIDNILEKSKANGAKVCSLNVNEFNQIVANSAATGTPVTNIVNGKLIAIRGLGGKTPLSPEALNTLLSIMNASKGKSAMIFEVKDISKMTNDPISNAALAEKMNESSDEKFTPIGKPKAKLQKDGEGSDSKNPNANNLNNLSGLTQDPSSNFSTKLSQGLSENLANDSNPLGSNNNLLSMSGSTKTNSLSGILPDDDSFLNSKVSGVEKLGNEILTGSIATSAVTAISKGLFSQSSNQAESSSLKTMNSSAQNKSDLGQEKPNQNLQSSKDTGDMKTTQNTSDENTKSNTKAAHQNIKTADENTETKTASSSLQNPSQMNDDSLKILKETDLENKSLQEKSALGLSGLKGSPFEDELSPKSQSQETAQNLGANSQDYKTSAGSGQASTQNLSSNTLSQGAQTGDISKNASMGQTSHLAHGQAPSQGQSMNIGTQSPSSIANQSQVSQGQLGATTSPQNSNISNMDHSNLSSSGQTSTHATSQGIDPNIDGSEVSSKPSHMTTGKLAALFGTLGAGAALGGVAKALSKKSPQSLDKKELSSKGEENNSHFNSDSKSTLNSSTGGTSPSTGRVLGSTRGESLSTHGISQNNKASNTSQTTMDGNEVPQGKETINQNLNNSNKNSSLTGSKDTRQSLNQDSALGDIKSMGNQGTQAMETRLSSSSSPHNSEMESQNQVLNQQEPTTIDQKPSFMTPGKLGALTATAAGIAAGSKILLNKDKVSHQEENSQNLEENSQKEEKENIASQSDDYKKESNISNTEDKKNLNVFKSDKFPRQHSAIKTYMEPHDLKKLTDKNKQSFQNEKNSLESKKEPYDNEEQKSTKNNLDNTQKQNSLNSLSKEENTVNKDLQKSTDSQTDPLDNKALEKKEGEALDSSISKPNKQRNFMDPEKLKKLFNKDSS